MDEALDAAIGVFWERGYQGASMTDLVAATGLQKGSLYKAFEDKHDLFMKSLARYLEGGLSELDRALRGAVSPKAGLKNWLEAMVVERSCTGDRRVGCFAVNSVVELGVADETVRRQLEAHFARMRRTLGETIHKGQEQGELRDDLSAGALSDFVISVASGLLALSKGQISKSRGKDVVDPLCHGDDVALHDAIAGAVETVAYDGEQFEHRGVRRRRVRGQAAPRDPAAGRGRSGRRGPTTAHGSLSAAAGSPRRAGVWCPGPATRGSARRNGVSC